MALLAVPSISADPTHEGDMLCAAEMVGDGVRRAGGIAEVVATSGHPLVVGEVPPSDDSPDAPVVTVYGHYDVQPPGDLALWTSPPFQPEVRHGMVFARGATDDKGNLFMLLVALQRLRAEERLTVRARILIDGEEESGGHSAVDFIAAEADPARAAVIFDSPMIGPGRPAICTGLRGLAHFRVRVRGGEADLHSGMYGGAALNSVHALMQVLQAVVARDGRVPAPLLEGTPDPSHGEVDAWATLPGGDQMLAQAGGRPLDDRAVEEYRRRTTMLPSVDVHGIRAGDPSLVATVIPAVAEATVSCRIPPGADADRLAQVMRDLMQAACPPGADLEVEGLGVAGSSRLDPSDPVITAAMRGITEGTGLPVTPLGIGGSIPVVAAMADRGTSVVLSGFGLPDDGLHAPDEHMRLENLDLGVRGAMGLLSALGALT
ncbi:MAG: M20 family dipeptidase [Actinobacteria bacterium]|nr:M20 family dipeptidase [Actinomycetota bacterium]